MTDEDKENRSRWRLEGEKYPNETKLHNFCASPDQTDKERHLFYAGIPSIWDCSRVRDIIKRSPLERREWMESNPVRTALKYSPIISFGMYLFIMLYAEATPLAGVSNIISIDFKSTIIIFIASLFIALLPFLFHLLTSNKHGSTLEGIKDIYRPFLFYFGLLIMLIGVFASLALVTIGDKSAITAEDGLKTNVIFTSGYFLTLYIGGPMVYDGILRTENLFNNLTDLNIVEGNSSQEDSPDSVIGITRFRQPVYIFIFASVLVSPAAFVWGLGNGPFGTGSSLILILNIIFDVIIVTLVIYFLLINRTLHSLLSASEGSISLGYDPHHPDLKAGYRDFGRFASRVNLILVLSVFYVIYRLYVQGRLSFVVREMSFSPEKIRLGGFISYIMPALAFILVSFVWFYSSFWLMHRAMERERKNWLYKMSKEERKEIIDYKDTLAARDAPTWPVDQRFLVAVLSADVVSLGVALSTFFA